MMRENSHHKSAWWDSHSVVRKCVNQRITGQADVDWIDYTLDEYFKTRLPLPHCLSLGCGTGQLERRLAQQSAFIHCDGFEDIGEPAINMAKMEAEARGLDNIDYHVVEMNQISLPIRRYDVVWAEGTLFHIADLERICKQIRASLMPNGLFILNEYVGPSKFQFPQRQKEIANLCLQLLRKDFRILNSVTDNSGMESHADKYGPTWFFQRLIDKAKEGNLIEAIHRRMSVYIKIQRGQEVIKNVIYFPSAKDVERYDPTLAVRSGEIIEVLEQDFEIIEKKGYGGNILQFLLDGITDNFSETEQTSQTVLKMLIRIEDAFLQLGEFESDFAYIVAKPLVP
jgi:2-polyprenyl-3-methyl-5-hydroxy-6-metoxy-1,4-benzoquinol methylase